MTTGLGRCFEPQPATSYIRPEPFGREPFGRELRVEQLMSKAAESNIES